MSARRWAALFVGALLCSPLPSLASPPERGIAAYEEGEYAVAIEALSARLELGVADPVERTRLRAYLASAHLARQNREASRAVLARMLDEEPSLALDDTVFPPALLTLLDELRRERAPAPQPTPQPTAPAPNAAALLESGPEEPAALGLAFVPFGGGQFANDEPRKGTLFLLLEAAAFGTAGISLGMFEASKAPASGALLAGGRFEDPARAHRLQTTYLVGFWTGVAIAAVGIGDALLSRPEEP